MHPKDLAVISDFPTYLKLHLADEVVAIESPVANFDLDRFCSSFTAATGYQLDYGEDINGSPHCFWSIEVAGYDPSRTLQFAMSNIGALSSADELPSADDRLPVEGLASECANLIDDLHRTERALREREAELAAAIPLTVEVGEPPEKLASRLTAILAGGARAVNCQAAAIYMLDDETRHLKVRATWALPTNRYIDPPRTLRGSKADLEALAGHAVVLEKLADLPNWNPPETYESAVCVPVSTATMPLGTMWVFSDEQRGFTNDEVNLLEIIAGRVAGELEREVLIRESASHPDTAFMEDAIACQQARLPQSPPDVEHWEVAGTTGFRSSLCSDDYYWYHRVDGRIFASLHALDDDSLAATWTAAMLAGTVRGQSEAKNVRDVLTVANRTLWMNSTGDQSASLAAAIIDPKSGRVSVSAAGHIGAFVIRPHGWEVIETTDEMVGADQALDIASARRTLHADDLLLLVAGCPRRRPAAESTIDGAFFAETLLHHNQIPVSDMVGLLQDLWSSEDAIWRDPPALLIMKRVAPV